LSAAEEAARKERCDRWDVSASEAAEALRRPTKIFEEFELVVETEEREAPDNTEGMKYVNSDVGNDLTEQDLDDIEEDIDKDIEQLATFSIMLKSDPDQVLRYCPDVGAKPLWPSVSRAPQTNNIPCCSRCGASRKFEFQILPTIISQLGVDAENDYALDFGSIAVYTCSKSCPPVPCDETSKKTGAYAEEYVVVHPPLNQ
jgi:pre-rRNA-processing protein TSR4